VPIHFANPIALSLLALLVPVVLWARRSMAGLGRLRGTAALVLRLVIVTLIILALAQAQWRFTRDEMSVIYALDQSLSIPPGDQRRALEYVRESQKRRRSGDTAGLVLFGRQAALERRPMPRALLQSADGKEGEIASLQSVVSPQRTNIAAALRLALAAFPPSGCKRIVLLSDGNENLGSALEEAEAARRNDVRIDVLPVRYEYTDEVMVEKVVAPARVDKRAAFDVRTVVTAHRPQTGTLRICENGRLIATEKVDLKQGRNVFVVPRELPEPGYYTYDATIESGRDTLFANNRASAFTMVRGEGRVLYVEGDVRHARSLSNALAVQGLDVHLAGPEILPPTLGEIIPYDALILSNVAAAALGEEGMRVVELAVKDWGVGLVMIGSENTFGPGGYQDSPVERALPVSMDIKQRRIMPSGALVVILHTCEIAQGNYWAQQIALAALRVLSATDEYGVLYYDWQGGEKWLFPVQRVADKSKMATLISGVHPGDMPSFIGTMQKAHAALKKSTASVKHVVVISDGDPAYPSDTAVRSMVADGITISTVGISPHSQTDTARLAHVAALGKGRYYQPQTASMLPKIFIKEAATVRRSLIFEETFTPKVAMSSEIVKGIQPSEFPPLRGYVVTTPKQLAEVPLVTHQKDPLLAHWQYGLGRAVAFTSDAKARWAAHWISWGKYARFWAQVVRWVSRSVKDAGLQVRTEVAQDRAHVVVDAIDEDGRFINGIRFQGTLVTPDNKEIPLKLEQTGPGRYEADFAAGDTGPHYMALTYHDEKGRPVLYTHGLVIPYSSEYRELRANEPLLRSIAQATDARVLKVEDDVFARTFHPAPREKEAWPLLLLIAVLLVPADVFLRRVFVDYAAVWTRLAAFVQLLVGVGRRAARPTHVSALLSRKRLTQEQIARRARKFEPTGETRVKEPALTPEAGEEKPDVEPAEPPAPEVPGPAITRDDDTYTGRLLRAKRRHRDETKEKED